MQSNGTMLKVRMHYAESAHEKGVGSIVIRGDDYPRTMILNPKPTGA